LGVSLGNRTLKKSFIFYLSTDIGLTQRMINLDINFVKHKKHEST